MKDKLIGYCLFIIKVIFIYLVFLYLMVAVVQLSAQEQPGIRDRAALLFKNYEYANAAEHYLQLVDTRNPRLVDLERLAACYEKMNAYEAAENWYARVVQHPDCEPGNLISYADVLKRTGNYHQAKKILEHYVHRTGDHEKVALAIAGCDSAVVWIADPTAHKLRNEAGVNTEYAEFAAFPIGNKVFYAGEPTPYLHGERYGWTGNAFLRIYTADRASDNVLSKGTLADEQINSTDYHVGPLASPDGGKTLYVTRTYSGKDNDRHKEGRLTVRTNRLELQVLTKEPTGWREESFAYNNVKSYSVGHAAFSPDGDTLYFVSDMPGGQGGTDLWFSVKQPDQSWGKPVNCGAAVNSPGDELFPNIATDGTLYFASDGHIGMGGLDIFRATGSGAAWHAIANMRHPVNSAGDDFAYVINVVDSRGTAGYLSSNRRGQVGGDDLYSFTYERPQIMVLLIGTVSDKSTGEHLSDAAVTLFDGQREIVAKKSSNADGQFEFAMDVDRQYMVLGQHEGYHADSVFLTTAGVRKSDTVRVSLLLEPVFRKGATFELENIYYDFDKHDIRPDAAAILEELVRTLRDNPTLVIELSSHTDSRGSDAYNLALSQRRAEAAVDYLVKRGIARERTVARGYGETRLVNRCGNGVSCSREEHQANRRTEVTVLAY